MLQEDRETLREQLRAAPAEGDPNDVAINIAKVCYASLMDVGQRVDQALALLLDASASSLSHSWLLRQPLLPSSVVLLQVCRCQ